MKKLVAIDDLAHDLGLVESDVIKWIEEEKINVKPDFRGRPAVEQFIKDRLAQRKDFNEAFKRSLLNDRKQKEFLGYSKAEIYKEKRLALIEEYKQFIDELQKIHETCLENVNFHGEESSVRAAYLLFAKAINCLRMGCENLRMGYWYAGSIIREIDEAIHLAEYFVVTEGTEEEQKDLIKWFRLNYAPKHSKCRDALANHMSILINDIGKENHQQLMNELYQKKSKWTHPTFNVIREITDFNVGDQIEIEKLSYGPSNYEFKLYELTDFYKSSIWSTFQAFTICFSQTLPLSESVRVRLIEIDRYFQAWDKSITS